MSLILTQQTKIVVWQDADFTITTPSIPNNTLTDEDIAKIKIYIENNL